MPIRDNWLVLIHQAIWTSPPYSTRTYLTVFGLATFPVTPSVVVIHKLFPSSLIVERVTTLLF